MIKKESSTPKIKINLLFGAKMIVCTVDYFGKLYEKI